MSVSYDHIHGKRVRVTRGYQAGMAGTVIRATYVSMGTRAGWIIKIKPDSRPKHLLGTDPDGDIIASVSDLEALESYEHPNGWTVHVGGTVS